MEGLSKEIFIRVSATLVTLVIVVIILSLFFKFNSKPCSCGEKKDTQPNNTGATDAGLNSMMLGSNWNTIGNWGSTM